MPTCQPGLVDLAGRSKDGPGRMEPVDFGDPRSGPLLAPVRHAVDISSLKGRIGEAFVESILRQSGFKVSRLGRESQVQQLLKTGGSEFLPDFLIWKPADQSRDGVPLHRLLRVEVKIPFQRRGVSSSFRIRADISLWVS